MSACNFVKDFALKSYLKFIKFLKISFLKLFFNDWRRIIVLQTRQSLKSLWWPTRLLRTRTTTIQTQTVAVEAWRTAPTSVARQLRIEKFYFSISNYSINNLCFEALNSASGYSCQCGSNDFRPTNRESNFFFTINKKVELTFKKFLNKTTVSGKYYKKIARNRA